VVTPTVTGGLLALGIAVLVLMHLDRRTIVMGAVVAAMAVLLAYTDFPPDTAGSTPVATQSGVR
jgi:hypothetical protein